MMSLTDTAQNKSSNTTTTDKSDRLFACTYELVVPVERVESAKVVESKDVSDTPPYCKMRNIDRA